MNTDQNSTVYQDQRPVVEGTIFSCSNLSSSGSRSTSKSDDCEDDALPQTYKDKYSCGGQKALANVCINAIRFLCIDAINHANSGHPGICMGMAATAFVLFDNHIKFNPKNPSWYNRDRFVLSSGHGSMLLYAVLFICGYDSVSLEDLKRFRQIGSKTPGHPECTETPGVEVCTGPLGQGICNAVGIAMAEAHMAAVYSRPGLPVIDNYTYCIAGDGCMMEGLTGEACSLAGHQKLGKLIVMYDDNHISIDGSTDLAFTEDVSMRFKSYGWQVIHVKDGNTDVTAINAAILSAKQCTDKPTLIKITTTIGYGSPNRGNTAKVHGSALGPEETAATRETLRYEYKPFEIPRPALEHMRRMIGVGRDLETSWQDVMEQYKRLFPELSREFEQRVVRGEVDTAVEENLRDTAVRNCNKSQATRKHSKLLLNSIASSFPGFLGGSADTSPSTLTDIECSKDFTAANRLGRNIRFGVREHAMAAISNGIALSGYNLRPFCSTFFVFSDYMRAAMRMASLSRCGTIFITTHDSIGLGEDGPSHQPVEHLASFRAMPNHDVWRPADSVETGAAYSMAIAMRTRPSTLVLSRQSTPSLENTIYENAKRGGYVALEAGDKEKGLDGIIIATGTELSLALDAARQLRKEEGLRVRVVSLPCWEEFERQDKNYKRSVLCLDRERILSVEAGSSFGWSRYADHHVSVDEFGKSGDGSTVLADFGLTVENVRRRFLEMQTMV